MSAASSTQTDSRWLALFLPRLSTDRLIRAGRAPEGRPLAVYAKEANAFLLTGVDARACELGLQCAMSLADARAIRPDLAALPAEPEEDARTLDAIAAWCERYTPIVVIDAPDGLFLDITGCAHLFDGEQALLREIISRLQAQGFGVRAAIAPTPGAAWALARYGKAMPICGKAAADPLAPLPVEALRLEMSAAALLQRLGLKTIGQLIEAPRLPFTARAGEAAMLRLDQALGRAPEALTPRRPAPPVFAQCRFVEPLFTLEAVEEAARRLCAELVRKLDLNGAGARRLELHLFGVDGRDRVIEIGLSRPERNAAVLLRLFREKLARVGENLNMEFGLEAARLDVAQAERLDAQARALVAAEESTASAERISALADVLSARLGPKQVLRPKLRDTHHPEQAGAWRSALSSATGVDANPPQDGVQRRPLTIFAQAQPIEAIATVPDGPPIRFRWRRVVREVVRAEGPERISGAWFQEAPTRDYYRVEDREGRRYWLYREGLFGEAAPPRWFVQGLFA